MHSNGLEKPASQFSVSATYPTDAKAESQITEHRQCFGTKQHIHGTVLVQNTISPKLYFRSLTRVKNFLPLNEV